jgi:hypothetical protein
VLKVVQLIHPDVILCSRISPAKSRSGISWTSISFAILLVPAAEYLKTLPGLWYYCARKAGSGVSIKVSI